MDEPKEGTRKRPCGRVFEFLDDELYWAILGRVRRRMRGSRRSGLEPEDCAQEACLRAAEHSSSFKGRTRKQALAWILGIAENRLLQLFRQNSFEESHLIHGLALDELLAHGPSQELCEEEELRALLENAIDSCLCESDRSLVREHYFEDKPLSVLAESPSVSDPGLRKRLSRALAKLREHLRRLEWLWLEG